MAIKTDMYSVEHGPDGTLKFTVKKSVPKTPPVVLYWLCARAPVPAPPVALARIHKASDTTNDVEVTVKEPLNGNPANGWNYTLHKLKNVSKRQVAAFVNYLIEGNWMPSDLETWDKAIVGNATTPQFVPDMTAENAENEKKKKLAYTNRALSVTLSEMLVLMPQRFSDEITTEIHRLGVVERYARRVSTFADAINHAFDWDRTVKGYDYWSKLNIACTRNPYHLFELDMKMTAEEAGVDTEIEVVDEFDPFEEPIQARQAEARFPRPPVEAPRPYEEPAREWAAAVAAQDNGFAMPPAEAPAELPAQAPAQAAGLFDEDEMARRAALVRDRFARIQNNIADNIADMARVNATAQAAPHLVADPHAFGGLRGYALRYAARDARPVRIAPQHD